MANSGKDVEWLERSYVARAVYPQNAIAALETIW